MGVNPLRRLDLAAGPFGDQRIELAPQSVFPIAILLKARPFESVDRQRYFPHRVDADLRSTCRTKEIDGRKDAATKPLPVRALALNQAPVRSPPGVPAP